MRRHMDRARYELVPRVRKRPSLGADRAGECVEQKESARDLPSAEVSGGGAAPGVRAEALARGGDDLRDLLDRRRRNARFLFCERECVRCVQITKFVLEVLEL